MIRLAMDWTSLRTVLARRAEAATDVYADRTVLAEGRFVAETMAFGVLGISLQFEFEVGGEEEEVSNDDDD